MSVYYLKILLFTLFPVFCQIESAAIGDYDDDTADKSLILKSLPFEDCGSRYLILSLDISCCSTIPCVMKRGSTAEVNVIFDDENDETSFLKHQVRWILNAIKTEAYITPDPCEGNQCLTNKKNGKSYLALLHVNNTLPMLTGSMMWEADNQYNQQVLCFKVPVVITL